MKSNKLFFLLTVLFILSAIGAGYIAPIIFLKWFIFLLIVFFTLRGFYKRKKNNQKVSATKIAGAFALIIILGFVSVPVTDIAKAKKNSAVCPFTSPHKSDYYSQAGIKNSFDFKKYINELKEAASFLQIKPDSIKYETNYYEYLTIKYEPKNYSKKILIIASVHGDEPAGALSITELLKDIKQNESKYQATAMWILCSMNPVGLALGSRENECGCNLNRDYSDAGQVETKHIKKNIETFHPGLILDLHENNGNFKTCLMANTLVPDSFGKQLCESLSAGNIDLAKYAFDLRLEIKGWHKRSRYRESINKIAGLNDLMWYGQTLNVPIITLECEQSLPIEKRILICRSTIETIVQNINSL